MPPTRLSAALLTSLYLVAGSVSAATSLSDADGRVITLEQPPRRIVSLAPHVTELLFAAGAGAKVVGVVEYSDFPPAARQLPRVGSYSALNLEAVAALEPDLVVGWKSGNRDGHLERLRALGFPLFVSEASSLEDVAASVEQLGRLAGTEEVARRAATAFRERRDALAGRYGARPPVAMFYQIWNEPLMTINGQHLISAIMRLCGGRNVFADLARLAPTINPEAVIAADPEVIVASGMDTARPEWLDDWRRWPRLRAVASDNLFFIPPDLLQRHTPRVLDGAEMLCRQLEQARAHRR